LRDAEDGSVKAVVERAFQEPVQFGDERWRVVQTALEQRGLLSLKGQAATTRLVTRKGESAWLGDFRYSRGRIGRGPKLFLGFVSSLVSLRCFLSLQSSGIGLASGMGVAALLTGAAALGLIVSAIRRA